MTTSRAGGRAARRVAPRRVAIALAAGALTALAACEPGGKNTAQLGYRGVGMEAVSDPDVQRERLASNAVPAPLPPAPPGGPAPQWQNVQVLNDLSVGEFTRTMTAITNWVAPKTGPEASCNYCHNAANLASDEKYPKVVARRMLAMTRDLNTNWRAHVGQTGVTCYTCHAGAPVPRAGLWTLTDENQYLRAYLDRADVRIQSYAALPTDGNRSSIKQTENTYALMINMSNSLGVNCTFCHNSRAWATWQGAPATRVTALYGLRMTRHLNTAYVGPLAESLPEHRLGARGDAPKVGCATCHNGLHKPLAGAQMVRDYPGLWGHAGPWTAQTAADSTRAGIVDHRDPQGVPTDASPRLPDVLPPSRAAGAAPPAPAPRGAARQATPVRTATSDGTR